MRIGEGISSKFFQKSISLLYNVIYAIPVIIINGEFHIQKATV